MDAATRIKNKDHIPNLVNMNIVISSGWYMLSLVVTPWAREHPVTEQRNDTTNLHRSSVDGFQGHSGTKHPDEPGLCMFGNLPQQASYNLVILKGPPDPDIRDSSAVRDDASTYDNAMDALVTSDLTGQTTTTTPKTRPTPSKTLEKVFLPTQALTGPSSGTPALLEGSRKRHRARAPSPSPLDESEDITGTPRSI
ncbi:hypothetical protein DFH28DRAFT_936378 [Melampsora americana]|nr:hypothetical protein DFH28DRAFT_936378 [Melampsora americana]